MIELKNVAKTYHVGREKISALLNVSLKIKEGEFIAVVGKSGSGKSTLLNILGGLDTPTSGHVYFGEQDLAKMKDVPLSKFRNKNVGFVFQDYLLIPHLNVLENVMTPALFGKIKDAKERAKKLIHEVGLTRLLRYRPNQLSGGQKQRVAIARSLIMDPSLILADEPTGNLDSKTGQEIIELFKRLHKERQTTFVIATHDSEIARISRKIVRLTDGKIH